LPFLPTSTAAAAAAAPEQLQGANDTSSCLGPSSTIAAAGGSAEAQNELDDPRSKQVNTSRCWRCNRKVGLLGFQCRCGFYFCGDHRYADTHDCAFDYKTFGREQLSKANQKVVAEKLHKI